MSPITVGPTRKGVKEERSSKADEKGAEIEEKGKSGKNVDPTEEGAKIASYRPKRKEPPEANPVKKGEEVSPVDE